MPRLPAATSLETAPSKRRAGLRSTAANIPNNQPKQQPPPPTSQTTSNSVTEKTIKSICSLGDLLDDLDAPVPPPPARTAASETAKAAPASSARVHVKRVAMLRPPPPPAAVAPSSSSIIPQIPVTEKKESAPSIPLAQATNTTPDLRVPMPSAAPAADPLPTFALRSRSGDGLEQQADATKPRQTSNKKSSSSSYSRSKSTSSNSSASVQRRQAGQSHQATGTTARQGKREAAGGGPRPTAASAASRSTNTITPSGVFGLSAKTKPSSAIDEGLDSSDEDGPKFRSIHALREAGETKRFRDEMAYLFEGLSSLQPKDVRRAAALDLMHKLDSDKFVANIRAHACAAAVLDCLYDTQDPALQVILIYFVWVLSRDARNIESLSSCEHLPAVVVQAVVVPDPLDSLATLQSGSKQDRSIATTLRDLIANSVWMRQSGMASLNISLGILGTSALADIANARGKLAGILHTHVCATATVAALGVRTRALIQDHASATASSDTWAGFTPLRDHLRALEFGMSHQSAVAALDTAEVEAISNSILALAQRLSSTAICHEANKAFNLASTELLIATLRTALTLANNSAYSNITDYPGWVEIILGSLASLQKRDTFSLPAANSSSLQGSTTSESTTTASSPSPYTEITSLVFDLALLLVSLLSNLFELHPRCVNLFLDDASGVCTAIMADLRGRLAHVTDAPDDFVMTAHLCILFGALVKYAPLATPSLLDRDWFSLCSSTRDHLVDFAEFHDRMTSEHAVSMSESEINSAMSTKQSILGLIDSLNDRCGTMSN